MTTRIVHIPPRGNLRLADLKQRTPEASRLLDVILPGPIIERIDDIATRVGASKTEVFVALLNVGLDALNGRKRK